MKRIAINIPQSLSDKADRIAQSTNRSRKQVLEELVTKHAEALGKLDPVTDEPTAKVDLELDLVVLATMELAAGHQHRTRKNYIEALVNGSLRGA